MIVGSVNAEYKPIIRIGICSPNGQVHKQDAIVDTGFNGWLSLSPDVITAESASQSTLTRGMIYPKAFPDVAVSVDLIVST
ncbi:MAG TPA: hypothetical protein DEV81_13575 [Cyanobacteria bacterium UBA11049]|nr:hypothetical protein [Cyanobacteria bacterium UBA11049]